MIELLLEAETALSLGLLDRAEILYRQVAGADPRNSIAVVGLARVLLERGDEAGALKQARRALAIDAENTAAQRMVQRLEEVLEERRSMALANPGMPVPTPTAGDVSTSEARSEASSEATVSAPVSVAAPYSSPPAESVTPTQETHRTLTEPMPEVPPPTQPRAVRSLIDRLLRRRD